MNNEFLPMSLSETDGQPFDFIMVTPDAYVDHPSFAAAIIGRYVQSLGFSVGIIAQPDWRSDADFTKLGTPRYAFLLSGGNMDGIVNMYTAAKRLRSEDAYSPGGRTGLRPPRPTIAYTARLKQSHKETPVIIGGVEATQRRFAHYDYYEDKVRRSYLIDSKADMLVFGMGEHPLKDICTRLAGGESIAELTGIRGTCVLRNSLQGIGEHIVLPSYERVEADKKTFADAFKVIYKNGFPQSKTLVQAHGDRYVIQFPPSLPLSTPEMDAIYSLPFQKRAHPSYTEPIPALAEVQFGITALRGCPGMCAFCSISAHQGKAIQKRSKKSIVEETKRIAQMHEFKGNISDVGGPTANFYDAICTAKNSQSCTRTCLSPEVCPNLKVTHKGITEVLEAVESVPGVKRVFIRSGLRYDYIMADKDHRFFDRLVRKHVSGQLKVAPEHVCPDVLALMNKPHYGIYERFAKRFEGATTRAGKPQYLLPYYISSHPGSTLSDAIELAVTLKKQGFVPDQVQDFYPTPGTLSTCMYYTGLNPLTGKSVFVATTQREKAMQRALLAFHNKKNWPLIREALIEAGREDLIEHGKNALVPPEAPKQGGGKPRTPAAAGKSARQTESERQHHQPGSDRLTKRTDWQKKQSDTDKPESQRDTKSPNRSYAKRQPDSDKANKNTYKSKNRSDDDKPRKPAEAGRPEKRSDWQKKKFEAGKPNRQSETAGSSRRTDGDRQRKQSDTGKPKRQTQSDRPGKQAVADRPSWFADMDRPRKQAGAGGPKRPSDASRPKGQSKGRK